MKKAYIIIAIMGTLWGGLETQLGTLLHAADLPFTGLLMMSLGLFFQTITRQVTQKKGSALLLAIVAVFIKLLIVGGIAFSVAIAIFLQSALLELIYFHRNPSRLRMALGGATAVAYSLFHPFLSMPLFMGLSVRDALNHIVINGSNILGINASHIWILLFFMLAIHLICGFVVAFAAFTVVTKLQARGLAPSVGKT